MLSKITTIKEVIIDATQVSKCLFTCLFISESSVCRQAHDSELYCEKTQGPHRLDNHSNTELYP